MRINIDCISHQVQKSHSTHEMYILYVKIKKKVNQRQMNTDMEYVLSEQTIAIVSFCFSMNISTNNITMSFKI